MKLLKRRWAKVLVAAAAIAALTVGIVLAADGGEDSLAEARSEFIANCVNGEDGAKQGCRCLADQLQNEHNHKRPGDFERLDEQIRKGRSPQALEAALQACAGGAAGAGAGAGQQP